MRIQALECSSRAPVDHRQRYHGAAMGTEAVRFLAGWIHSRRSRSSTSCARRTACSASSPADGTHASRMTSGDAWPSRAGSSESEYASKLVPLGGSHLRRTVSEYVVRYHRERNHQGVGHRLLTPWEHAVRPASNNAPIERRERPGGLLNFYCRRTAWVRDSLLAHDALWRRIDRSPRHRQGRQLPGNSCLQQRTRSEFGERSPRFRNRCVPSRADRLPSHTRSQAASIPGIPLTTINDRSIWRGSSCDTVESFVLRPCWLPCAAEQASRIVAGVARTVEAATGQSACRAQPC